MSKWLSKIFSNNILLIAITLAVKIPVFLTKHIQEDSFITWRVAKNLLNYGVIGFNGEDRISASTTHLYTVVSAFFQLIFGEDFIYPILVFSAVLFAIGSIWLGKILFPQDTLRRGFFVVLLNLVPPAITASCVGMEYGILFFLYCGLIYYGFFKLKNWAFFLFPILLLWTRVDTVIFLGVMFLADLYLKRKLNWTFIVGGVVGLVSVVGFNYFYFGELVNHTISAKKIAYKNLTPNNNLDYFLIQWAYYGGLIKKYSFVTLFIFLGFLALLCFAMVKIIKNKDRIANKVKVILVAVVVFALLKISVFAFLKAYFDWYYWLPRVFLFVAVIYYLLNFVRIRKRILVPSIFLIFIGLYLFQLVQSYAIGYMENTQRVQIAKDIAANGTNMEQSILLEPAGKIPFYTNLYTYDEVGLVNKKILDEMTADELYWWMNSVRKFQPDYILSIGVKPDSGKGYYQMKEGDKAYFDEHYSLVKEYPIAEIHQNAPEIVKLVYGVRPIGKDYFLYVKRNGKP